MSTTTCSMSETGERVARARPGEPGGASARIFRRLAGKANDASTMPPADAMSWRLLISIVTRDLLNAEAAAAARTGAQPGQMALDGLAAKVSETGRYAIPRVGTERRGTHK